VIIIAEILAYIVFTAIDDLIIVIPFLAILQSRRCCSTAWLRHWTHIAISGNWCDLADVAWVNWLARYFTNARHTLNTCSESARLMLVHRTHSPISLIQWLVEEALRQQDLGRLGLRPLVSTLWISSHRSVTRLVGTILTIWLGLSVLTVQSVLTWTSSSLCLLTFSIIWRTSRCLMSLIWPVSTDLFLWVKWWCWLLHVYSSIAAVIVSGICHQFWGHYGCWVACSFAALARTTCSSVMISSDWPVYTPCVLI